MGALQSIGFAAVVPSRAAGLLSWRAYLALCVIASILLGAPGYLLVRYLEEPNLAEAISTFHLRLEPEGAWQQAISLALWTIVPAYILLMIRLIRRRVASAEAAIAPMMTGGPPAYESAFAGIDRLTPPLVIGAAIFAINYPFILSSFDVSAGPAETVYRAVTIALYALIAGTALWVYGSALWGLHRLTATGLRLVSLAEDPMMGLAPVGALAVAISLPYLGLIALLVPIVVLGQAYAQFSILVLLLTGLGIFLLVYPLRGLHRQMLTVKGRHLQALRREILQPIAAPADAGTPGAAQDVATQLALLRRSQSLEAAERKVASNPEWPFDTSMVTRVAAVVASIVVPYVSRLALDLLNKVAG